ncbi:TPA: restriction endonuclease subunit S [Proteus mirabilis]|nr:restriction endonuclease subunit S [Proteus mirabilis]
MGSEWPLVKLGEYCCKIGSGATPKGGSSVYLDAGDVCLIRSQNIYNDGFEEGGLVYIDEVAAAKLRNVIVEHNDILLNITGDSVARVCLVPDAYLPARVNQHVAIIRPNKEHFDARFLRYFLASPKTQILLLNLSSAGATRNALTKSMIENFEVPKPSLSVQVFIANILQILDDKIMKNRQINQTLEQMAQTLFKSWFVDFDPVVDNALDAGFFEQNLAFSDELLRRVEIRKTVRKSDNFKPLAEDIRQLFPNAFEECAEPALGLGGWVPKRWEILTLSKLSKIASGKRPLTKGTVKTEEEPIPVWGGNGIKWFTDKPLSTDKYIITGRVGTLGTVYKVDGPSWASDNALVIKPLQHEYFEFIYQTLCNFDIHSLNSGSTQPLVTQTALSGIQLIFPKNTKLLRAYQKSIDIYDEKFKVNSNEVESLTHLRDTLLPKLISGELSLSDIKIDIPEETLI